MSEQRLFLIDGSGYLYRAFYGVKNLARRDGFPTNAIFGFIKMVRKVVEEEAPDSVAMVFDAKGPTFRHGLYDQYKATRKPMPDELRVQVPIIREAVAAWNIPILEQPGFEADDILATLARQGREAGWSVTIVTGDKDLMQMVGTGIRILDTAKERWIDSPQVEEFWGVPPALVTDVMGLCGDNSDNIPGVPQIGPKIAAQLIREFGSLDHLLANTAAIHQPKRRANLEAFADQARLSRRLATLDTTVELPLTVADLQRRAPDPQQLERLYTAMEFHSLLQELRSRPAVATTTQSPELAAVANDYRTVTTPAAFQAFLSELQAQKAFSVDSETTSIDPVQARLVGLSFAWRAHQAWYLPVAHQPAAAPDGQLDRDLVLAALKPILEDPEVAKTGQNIKYEYVVFRNHGIVLRGISRDAMLLSHLIFGPTRRHNLDAIALDLLGRTTISFKEVAGRGQKAVTFDHVPLDQAAPYACEDAEVAWQAAERLEPQLVALPGVARLCRELELPLIPVLGEMELAGALVDRRVLEHLSGLFSQRREVLVKTIHELAGEMFNVNSTQQLGEILFSADRLGLKGGKRTKTGFSTDLSVLTRLADQGHALPARVLEYRTLTKLQSTYTDALIGLINPATGRVHTSYNQAVTLTGRLSSSDPNLQNIPIRSEEGRAIRAAFIAPPGWVLIAADYSQIELRLLAHLGEVPRLREAFAQGGDIHTATAIELFGTRPDAVTPEQRRMAKTINFGLIYGMSPFGLAKRLGISNPEARAYMDLYFRRYAGVKEFMQRTIRQARANGYVETIGGRRCPIRDIDSSNRTLRELAERTAINAPIQGSAADLIKRAMVVLHRSLKDFGLRTRMLLQVHDELVLEAPEEERETVIPLIRRTMEDVMPLAVPLTVDVGQGTNWAEAH
ncbi:MAG: DNA polymerase I [Magnetococcales bacterium]|nr:DNA polymerase I [Magnetococcales bacterium]